MIAPNTNTNTNGNNNHQQQLPVVIAGAGPCGLVAAYCFQKYGVPFVIVERATREKICSNAGSGFELTPTSVEILQNRLGVDVSQFMSRYVQMNLKTMNGTTVRKAKLPESYEGGSVNRAEMQNRFLELLFPTPEDEEGILVCGSGVESYREDIPHRRVVVTLASGKELTGCVLLACDGIHSRCRGVLHGGYDSTQSWDTNCKTMAKKDPLHFCDCVCYWGKTPAPEGSNLLHQYHELIEERENASNVHQNLAVAVLGLSTTKSPAGYFVIPTQNYTVLNWVVTVKKDDRVGTHSKGDLTRRGGGPLTPADKKRLFALGTNAGDESLMKGVEDFQFWEALLAETPAEEITEAGLYDRKNLDAPFTSKSKLVALLGDSAHPQTPFLGQGVNMAIADAYIYATNIAVALLLKTKSLREAVVDSDQAFRRKSAKKVVKLARVACDFTITQNPLKIGIWKLYGRYAPTSELINQLVKTDKSNQDYLKHLDGKLCSSKQQEELRQQQQEQQQQQQAA